MWHQPFDRPRRSIRKTLVVHDTQAPAHRCPWKKHLAVREPHLLAVRLWASVRGIGSGQCELYGRARPSIGGCPDPTAMCLDDRAADREPIPMPSGLVVKNASNSRPAFSGSIPMPVSRTATSTPPS